MSALRPNGWMPLAPAEVPALTAVTAGPVKPIAPPRTEAFSPSTKPLKDTVYVPLKACRSYVLTLSFAVTLIYLAIRFEWRFGLAAVIATAHDIFTTITFILMMRLEVSLTVVAAILTVIGLVILIQLIPVWLLQTNPPAHAEPPWDSAATRTLAQDACFDCHSTYTVWPWYSRIAPVSWLVTQDVIRGRRHLNFSDWQSGPQDSFLAERAVSAVQRGAMPSAHPGRK